MAEDDSIPADSTSDERQSQLKLQRPPERILSGERFRRAQRLRSSRDFQRVRTQGRRVSGSLLTLGYAPQADSGHTGYTRIGFSVGRRVGGAVERNRVKRRLREVMRRKLAGIVAGYDLVITARPGSAEARLEALDQEVRALLARARLLMRELPETDRQTTGRDRGTEA